jgi:serine/threonine protein kinase
MTETNEIKNPSINLLVTGKDGAQEVLLIGLKPGYQDSTQYQRRLKLEYEQGHKIDHPNIIKYLEMKDVDGYGKCIVMEWKPARSLADYMQENHSIEERKNIIRQITDALNFLHRKGKIHGSLTPSYIYITDQEDHVKLLNFRPCYADRLSEPSESMKFRAPEAKDGTVTLDARTDIFSLGMILKELDLGPEYEDIVTCSCSLARNNRYPNVDSFRDAFEHRRHIRRGSTNKRSGAANSKRMGVLIATIVALAVIVGLAFFNRDNNHAEGGLLTSGVADSAQTAEEQPIDEITQPDLQPHAQGTGSTASTNQTYTGELEFLNKLVPQMHIDMDKIYASGGDKASIQAKLTTYYKGLRKALGNKTEEQFAAYDKAFMEYRAKKDAEL